MDATRWRRLQQLYEGAVEQPPEHRMEWLAEASAGDSELFRQAESLIQHDEKSTGIGRAICEAAAGFAVIREPAPSDRIGPYRILRLLGRGGMGAVFLAERDDDQFRQTVAIKLVRANILSPDTLARFKAERQILASLDHPNIAHLLDGGAAPNGMPYVVIEYIDGEPITEYCRKRHLPIRDRIHLFRKICSAVHYSHQNLIVHRDLKPGNILVTRDGEPKLLDFGIAKLLDPAVPAATETRARLMTPEYGSPEQVRGEPVTTASDIYALGVVLFELLTGERPYDVPSTSPLAVEQAICMMEPRRPSTLDREVRGDLETILLMALRKEPARRYASADRFSEDLGRYLTGYPVQARPDRWSYRTARFLRRNRAGTAAALAFALVLMAAVLTVSRQARRTAGERDKAVVARAQAEEARVQAEKARREEQRQREQAQSSQSRAEAAERRARQLTARAVDEAETARQISRFLTEVFQGSNPFDRSTRPSSIRDLVDRGARRLKTELRGQPAVRASLQDIIGRVYGTVGELDRAEELIREALATRRSLFGADHPDVASSEYSLSWILSRRSDLPSAETAARESVRIRRRGQSRGELAEALENLCGILQRKGDYPAAEKAAREALSIRQSLFGDNDPKTAESYSALGGLLRLRGNFPAAQEYLRRAYEIFGQAFGADHPLVANRANDLATVLFQVGRYAEAEALFRQALAIYRANLGEQDMLVANALNNLATVLVQKRDFDEAESLFRSALALNRKLVGEFHRQTADTLNNLGRVLIAKREFDAAESVMREAIEVRRRVQGSDHPLVAVALDGLGLVYREQGKFEAAGKLHAESLAIRRKKLRPDHPAIAVPLLGLAQVDLHFKRAAQAEPLLREALALRRKALPAGHWEIAEIASVLGGCLTLLGRYDEAESLLLESYPILRKEQGQDSRIVRETNDRILALYTASNQPSKAQAFARVHATALATGSVRKPDW